MIEDKPQAEELFEIMESNEMNNEPVAWMRTNKQWRKEISWVEKEGFDIPLYTHPAKTLTDEEIKSEAKYFCHSYHSENPERLVLFAKAILRKLQEK
jgi:hypothetical protein